MRRLPFLSLLLLTACSSTTEITAPTSQAPAEEQPFATPAPEETTPVEQKPAEPAFNPSFPVVKNAGGSVIKTPKVVPILFPNDPLAAQIDSFHRKLAGSQYWKTVTPEYGVGDLTAGTKITLTEQAPTAISSSAIETWLVGKLSGANPAFGAPDSNTLYEIFYPASTTITEDGAPGAAGQSCQGYGGYHSEVSVNGKAVGYAVMPRCAGIDDLTVAASHEIYEWATDPFPMTAPAFALLDDDHWAWQVSMYGELSDLCTYLDQDNLEPAELGFTVQRHWSNKLSLSGAHPCSPTKNIAYAQAVAETNTTLEVPTYLNPRQTQKTKAILVDPGKSTTVKVHVYADQPIASGVKLSAMNVEKFRGTEPTTGFTFSVAKSGNVGDTVEMTIKAPKEPTEDIVVMFASPDGGRAWHFWPFAVTNSADAEPGTGTGGNAIPRRMPKMFPRATGRRFTQQGLSGAVRGQP